MSKKTRETLIGVSSYQYGRVNEVLRPTLLSLSDGRCYRKMVHSFGRTEEQQYYLGGPAVPSPAMNDDYYPELDVEEEEELELEGVESLPGNKGFALKMAVPAAFYKYVIGHQGATKANIERETKTKIRVPQRGAQGGIVIEGGSMSCLANAKRRLDIIVWSNRLKEPVTHFISIPLNHPIITEQLTVFKSQVLSSCSNDRGISSDLFQMPAKFHLTVGVMRLFTEEEVEKATFVLEECVIEAKEVLGDEPVLISLSGLDCMNDDPSAVSVLYAKVLLQDSSDRLQRFVDILVDLFMKKAPDLMTKEFERMGVKLHATLLNTSFREQPSQEKKNPHKNRGPKDTFDARKILQDFGAFDFGIVPLQCVHLSKRGEYGPDRFYKCIKEYSLDTIMCG